MNKVDRLENSEDIAVSEEAEVRRVVRASLSLLAKETGALLRFIIKGRSTLS